ncbi:right-handed parallel beta-helix repeat-containing protein [uncultured Methanobrevibacter sp.]|uniref:right-handed parallel beta-helix repeat-containing protein n=1 Tax=uncultured Methanobrevibacter sp. TaxID=253161 RepID=UPI0025D18B18|nr:right-handed parallel beta-helix repeat-containing protein [uncultured Methanobrevibacter sp.]
MLKKRYLFLMVIVCLFAVSTVSAEEINNETNIVVNSQDSSLMTDSVSEYNTYLSDEEIQGSAADGTFSDLQKMIDDALEGSTISLERNYKYNHGFSTNGITINKVLSINGNGYTINALGQSGIFNTNSPLTLDNIVFKNGKLGGAWYGGAAIKTESSLVVKNSIFMDNAAYYGGAIYSSNDVNVTNCIFKNNKADGSGAQQCRGGAIYANKVEVDNSTFTGNYAHDYGGAIYADTVHTKSKSYFINNVAADDDGGAIYTQNVYIAETVFEGNSAYRNGGAIFNMNGVTVKNSTFRNNKAEGASVLQCEGGAIYLENLDANVVVDNCTFIGNHAADYGGAITGFANFDVSSSIFMDNSAGDNCGGAIYSKKSGIPGSLDFAFNIVNSIFDGNHAYDDGGAVYTTLVHVNVKNSTFRNNYADGAASSQCYGGAIAIESDLDYVGDYFLKIDNSTFTGNHAYDYGGAIYADVITWVNTPSYFINNYVNDNQGGAIYTNKFSNDVSNAVFIGNEVRADDDGGAIYINKANTVTFSQCYFEKNKCGDEGGAIYLDSLSSFISLKNNVFVDNSAGDKGHIVYNYGKYEEISQNWYGTNNPSFNNQFKEWGFFSDDDYSDSDPVITKLSLSENPSVGQTSGLTVDFLSKNSAKLSGKLFGIDAKFSADNGAEISNHQIGTNNVTLDITFNNPGLTTATATVNNQVLTLSYSPAKLLGIGTYNKVNTAVENTNAE